MLDGKVFIDYFVSFGISDFSHQTHIVLLVRISADFNQRPSKKTKNPLLGTWFGNRSSHFRQAIISCQANKDTENAVFRCEEKNNSLVKPVCWYNQWTWCN